MAARTVSAYYAVEGEVDLSNPAGDDLAQADRVLQVGAAHTMMTFVELLAFTASRMAHARALSCSFETTAMCMAVGKVSFEDWPRFTWSLKYRGTWCPWCRPRARWRGWR